MTLRFHKTSACVAAVVLLVTLQPTLLFACAACYGASDSPMAEGMNWGIFTLLGVILSVLTCVVAFFVHVGRVSAKLHGGERTQPELEERP